MKKSFLYIIAIFFALSSCSKNDDIFEQYFEDWDMMIPYQNVSKSKTYKLLDALIDNMDKNEVYIINFPSNSLNYPSVTKFNEYLWNNKETNAFFERGDCAFVLISTYLSSLKTNRYKAVDDGFVLGNKWLHLFDYVLTSEICMSNMNVAEKVRLMVLALERLKYGFTNVFNDGSNMISTNLLDYNIMISIMLSSNYTPFVNDIKPMLREAGMGAVYAVPFDNFYLIPECARQFINDNKK